MFCPLLSRLRVLLLTLFVTLLLRPVVSFYPQIPESQPQIRVILPQHLLSGISNLRTRISLEWDSYALLCGERKSSWSHKSVYYILCFLQALWSKTRVISSCQFLSIEDEHFCYAAACAVRISLCLAEMMSLSLWSSLITLKSIFLHNGCGLGLSLKSEEAFVCAMTCRKKGRATVKDK